MASRSAPRLEVEVEAGGELIGYAIALPAPVNGMPRVRVDREEVLRTAALAAIAEVAVAGARDELAADVRGSLLEDLRARRIDGAEAVGRAARLGCDLSAGAIALVAEVRSVAADARRGDDHRRAPGGDRRAARGDFAGRRTGRHPAKRLFAILPAPPGDDGPQRGRALGEGDQRAACDPTGRRPSRPSAPSPADLGRAIAEAELMLDVIVRDDRVADQLTSEIGNGVYRLLFRAMASDPDEVRRFYDETVEPLVGHDAPVPHRPARHARDLPRQRLQHERDRAGGLRAPPHRRAPARANPRADRARSGARATTASASGWGSRPTGSSPRRCRSSHSTSQPKYTSTRRMRSSASKPKTSVLRNRLPSVLVSS